MLLTAGGLAGISWAYSKALHERDAAHEAYRRLARLHVEQLVTAAPENVPSIIASLKRVDSSDVLLCLHEIWNEGDANPQRRMRAAMALLDRGEPGVKAQLAGWLLTAGSCAGGLADARRAETVRRRPDARTLG